MASKIKVDQIEGAGGSTITIPTGQTFTITDGLAVASLPTVTVAKGGTNLTSFTAGDLLYATGSTTLAKLGKGTAAQVLAMNSGATAPEWVAASGGKTIKRHYFEYSTRTAGSGTGDVFNFTSAFTPVDPTQNDIQVQMACPIKATASDWAYFGMNFTNNSGGTEYSQLARGIWYTDGDSYQSTYACNYVIPAGTIPAGTFTVALMAGNTNGAPTNQYFCLNTTDNANVGAQTTATLMLAEYKN